MEFIKNLKKFEVIKNSKLPAVKWLNPLNYKTSIDVNNFNFGIPTGIINNLIVFDVDEKDNGVIEIQNYIKKFGDINTSTIEMPNNGYHYILKYSSISEASAHLVNNLNNSSKYRGKGLDIRTNGGYIVGLGSSINNK